MSAKTKVAVLDDYQSLSKEPLSQFDISSFDITTFKAPFAPYNHSTTTSTQQKELVSALQPFDIISTMRERTPFPAELIQQLPNLKILLTTGLRNNGLDLPAFKKAGVKVYGAPGKGINPAPKQEGIVRPGPDSTTQHCVSLILGAARNLAQDDANVKAGLWQENVTVSLTGKTIGCVGFGRLGVAVAKIMWQSFGMRVIAWSSSLTQEQCNEKAAAAGLPQGAFESVSKEEVFSKSDIVSLHYVLSDRSRGIVSATDLAMMKPTAFFINTSRGPLVVEQDLLEALKNGAIRGAAIDVYDLEPLDKNSEWRTTKWGQDGRSHVLLTPHTGYVEVDTMRRWYEETGLQLEKIGKGQEPEQLLN